MNSGVKGDSFFFTKGVILCWGLSRGGSFGRMPYLLAGEDFYPRGLFRGGVGVTLLVLLAYSKRRSNLKAESYSIGNGGFRGTFYFR